MKSFVLIVFVFLNSTFIFSQQEQTYREGFVLKLPVNALNFYQDSIVKSPYFIKDDILQIYPGEKLFVEVEVKGKTILSMHVVKEKKNIERTLEIEFTQKVKGRSSEAMILKIYNPLEYNLKYKAAMYIVGEDDWLQTSVVPVGSKLYAYETWPDVIITLVLMDWELQEL